jgi:hypothetical protein
MFEPTLLSAFLKEHAPNGAEAFQQKFDGAFLLGRFKGEQPRVMFLSRDAQKPVRVGSDEDTEFEFELDQTLDPTHVTIVWHPGFRGWTIQDDGTSFGTEVDGERVAKSRPLLLADRAKIKLGGGLSELEFYLAPTLWQRMKQAGITRGLRRKGPAPERPADEAEGEEPAE